MRKLIIALLFVLPFSVGAITQDQAISLINVVQSSPGTPASTFTNLITAFSNVTVGQAESLINVVQAAPGVPANAFVNLLVSFTENVKQPVPTEDLSKKVDTLTQQVQQTNTILGQIQTNTAPISRPPTPVPVPIPNTNKLQFSGLTCIGEGERLECSGNIIYTKANGSRIIGVPITLSTDDNGEFVNYQSPDFVSIATSSDSALIIINSHLQGGTTDSMVFSYIPKKDKLTFTVSTPDGLTTSLTTEVYHRPVGYWSTDIH